jgi:hypothetical protein
MKKGVCILKSLNSKLPTESMPLEPILILILDKNVRASIAEGFGYEPVIVRIMGGTVPIVPLINISLSVLGSEF